VEKPTPAPESVDVDRTRSVTLTWADGHVSEFGLEQLRRNCPCAVCRNFRERGRPAWSPLGPAGELRAEGAELVGNWGLQLHWSDGHDTGIYTWSLLRAWCECQECTAGR
jgi:prepilin-type processing-associated H-X9-DG protein